MATIPDLEVVGTETMYIFWRDPLESEINEEQFFLALFWCIHRFCECRQGIFNTLIPSIHKTVINKKSSFCNQCYVFQHLLEDFLDIICWSCYSWKRHKQTKDFLFGLMQNKLYNQYILWRFNIFYPQVFA